MTQKSKDIIRCAMQNAKLDKLERAIQALRNETPVQMEEPCGHSGKTVAEILRGYELDRTEFDTAMLELGKAIGGW